VNGKTIDTSEIFFFESFPDDPLLLAITFSKKFSLFEKGDKVLVGLSGGRDSVFLTYILSTYKSKFGISEVIAAHFNHGVRGKESERDEKFSVSFCERLGIKIIVGRATSPLKSEDEMRRERYKFFDESAKKCEATKIATAHTLDDNFETFLINLVRRKGFFSFGIFPKNYSLCSVPVVRPLLSVKRSSIENYLKSKNISFVSDTSNLDLRYLRNRIRAFLYLIPQDMYDSILEGFLRFWASCYAVQVFLSETFQENKEKIPQFLRFEIENFVKGEIKSFEDIKKFISDIKRRKRK
jgi:tRNA(Ile)-lysidine synthase